MIRENHVVELNGRAVSFIEASSQTGAPANGPADNAAVEPRHDAPTVVILTGAGDTTASWIPVQDRVAEATRVLALDRAGMGGSAPRQGQGIDDYLDELHAFLNAIVVEPCVLVGHSFGGLLARVYATKHPDRIAGLVLVDPTPEALASARAARNGLSAGAGLARVLGARWARRLIELLLRLEIMPLYPAQRDLKTHLSAADYDAWKRQVSRNLQAAPGEWRAVIPAAAAAGEELAGPSRIGGMPVTFITSNAFGKTWVQMQADVAGRYPGARHIRSGDGFHGIHMRHPQLVVDAILAMLEELSTPTA